MPRFALHNADDPGFDVWAVMGQSNAAGAGSGLDSVYNDGPDPRVYQYANKASAPYYRQIIAAPDPLFHKSGSNTVGHALTFAKDLVRVLPPNRRVLLVPCAFTGSGMTTSSNPAAATPYVYSATAGIGSWDPSGADGGFSLYQDAVSQINGAIAAANAGETNRIAGFLWHQGEADTYRLTGTQYAAMLDALIAGLRATVTGATAATPFLLGQLLPEFIANNGANAAAINTAHIEAARRNEYVGFIYGPSGYDNGDHTHYNAAGQRILGHRAFSALLRARANRTGAGIAATPAAPTLTQSGTTVTAAWAQVVGRVTDFAVRYRVNGGTWTALTRTQSIDVAATISGLTLGDTLDVQVASVNEAGTSAWSPSGTLTLATLPGQVVGLTAGVVGGSTQALSWTARAGATSYLVEYKQTSSGTWLTSQTVTATSATVTGLLASTSYDYRVTATNAAGPSTTPSATVTASTLNSSPIIVDVGVTPAWAYGLRKMSSTSTRAIKVRRSSDNATTDVGFAAGTTNLDTAAMLTWAGSASVFIDTWYDQSGNGVDLTQATAAAQARIVNAGTLDVNNGHPTAVFSGSQYYSHSSPALYAANGMTTCAVAANSSSGNVGQILWCEGGTSNARYMTQDAGTATSHAISFTSRSDVASDVLFSVQVGTTFNAINTLEQLSQTDDGAQAASLANGTQLSVATYVRSGRTLTLTKFALGAYYLVGAFGSPWNGNINEMVAWTTKLTTVQRQAAEANQKAYWGTP